MLGSVIGHVWMLFIESSMNDALRKNASISISDAIRILGVQERQAQRILKSLVEEGSAVKIGAARATRYAEAKKRTELHE